MIGNDFMEKSAQQEALSHSRRTFLEGVVCGGVALSGIYWSSSARAQVDRPVVTTTAGKVSGVSDRGLATFKGIPYGASTAGGNRFMPPRKPTPWTGVRDALDYAPMSPQTFGGPLPPPADKASIQEAASVFKGSWRPHVTEQSEDCLALNVWTPGVADGGLRPVMVWLHGGGFSSGGGDWGCTEGGNLSRKNDVVVVSLNHRLNVFGFLYLGNLGGAEYAQSGNVGMLDVVAALEWVRDNISAFGGDPNNITVFGQSGGGGKVAVLMAMPQAERLFHKAIIQSGPYLRAIPLDLAIETTERLLLQLGLRANRFQELQNLPIETLLKGFLAAGAFIKSPYWAWDWLTWTKEFAPVIDGQSLLQHPFDPTAPAISAEIPMMVGSTAEELASYERSISSVELAKRMRFLGFSDAQAADLIKAYGESHPQASPIDIFDRIASDKIVRIPIIRQAERKVAEGGAPVFMYMFGFEVPVFGGKYKSPHAVDVSFVFDNVDEMTGLFGASPDARRYQLAEITSTAWATFAREGNPAHARLPEWRPYTLQDRATMVLNYQSEMQNDPWRSDRLAMTPFI